MNIVIHAGTHKTATSSFQYICGLNHLKFKQSGILYPILPHPTKAGIAYCQHSIFARDLSRTTPEISKLYFKQFYDLAKSRGLNTLFLSGEDFENILHDNRLLKNLLKLCNETGFSKPTFSFVTRDPYEYFCSLYGELSKKNIILDFKQSALAAAATGYLALPTSCSYSENFSFNNFFAIDSHHFIAQLKDCHPDLKINETSFTNFTEGKIGENLITKLFSPTLAKTINYQIPEKEAENRSPSNLKIELNYTKNFLNDDKNFSKEFMNEIASQREALRNNSEEFVLNLFQERYGKRINITNHS